MDGYKIFSCFQNDLGLRYEQDADSTTFYKDAADELTIGISGGFKQVIKAQARIYAQDFDDYMVIEIHHNLTRFSTYDETLIIPYSDIKFISWIKKGVKEDDENES